MGLFDSIFGSDSESESNFRPLSKTEKALQQLILDRAKLAQPLFENLLGSVSGEQGTANSQIGRALEESQLFNQLFGAGEAAQIAAGRERSVADLGQTDQDILNSILGQAASGPNATPEQLARIQESADLALGSGLSDLSRFRDQTFQSIRENSAGRGLRPTDTPILNEFSKSGEEFGRLAQNLISGVRQNQLGQELQLPFQNADLGLRQQSTASDIANRRRLFESNLAQSAAATRLGLADTLRSQALGLTTGGASPGQSLAALPQQQISGGSVTQTQSPFDALLSGALVGSKVFGF